MRFRLEPKKRKLSAAQQVELGVACDLRRAPERVVLLSPTPDRVQELLADLQAAEDAGRMTPEEASGFFGRVGFVLSTATGSVGRAAVQPLLQRSGEEPTVVAFTPAMRLMNRFLRALLPAVGPLELQVGQPGEPMVVVYTDASYAEGGHSGLGVTIFDGDEMYESAAVAPPWLLAWLRPRGQQINHLEAVAMVCARLTFPDVLRRRRVLHFVDNTCALSKAVHGYANEPDMAAAVHALHACDACLGCDAWFEWVPSKANIADLPSRDPATWDEVDSALLGRLRERCRAVGRSDRVYRRAMAMPSAAELDDPLLAMERARAL